MSRNGRYHGKVVSPEAASMVDLYLEDLGRYALLTPEEEDAIAQGQMARPTRTP